MRDARTLSLAIVLAASLAAADPCPPPVHLNPYNWMGVTGMTVGDFDRDGVEEVAVTSTCSDFGSCSNLSIVRLDRLGNLQQRTEGEREDLRLQPVAGDVDGNGAPDLLVLDSSGRPYLRRALGNGTFAAPEPLATTRSVRFATFADVNGDLRPDILMATHDGASIFLNLGGAFSPESHVAAGTETWAVAGADADGDGHADVILTNRDSDDVSILPGDGAGGFGSERRIPAGDQPEAVVALDLNGDAQADLVVADALGNDVAVLMSDGAGGFAPATHLPVGSWPDGLVVADLDGDGDSDVVVGGFASQDVLPLWNNAGTLVPGDRIGDLGLVAIADLDADGMRDLVTGAIDWHRNLGARRFAPHRFFAAGFDGVGVKLADVDRDGDLDALVANRTPPEVSVLVNGGDGTFTRSLRLPFVDNLTALAVGDFDGNGTQDIAVTTYAAGGTAVSLQAWLGDGAGGFGAPTVTSLTSGPNESLATGRMNADAMDDLVVGGTDGIHVELANGSGSFTPGGESYVPWGGATGVAVADVDRDGANDVVATSYGLQPKLVIFPGVGDGSLGPFVELGSCSNPMDVAAGDLNGDGWPDLVAASGISGADACVYLNAGDGTYLAPVLLPSPSASGEAVAIADFDGADGPDIAVADGHSELHVHFNRGGGDFTRALRLSSVNTPVELALGDVDGDLRPDLVAVGELAGGISVTGGPCAEPFYLMRNDEVTSLAPLTPGRFSVLPLDPIGPNGRPDEGRGDDDDADVFAPDRGMVDVDPDLGTGRHPLVFYQLTGADGILRVARTAAGTVAIGYY